MPISDTGPEIEAIQIRIIRSMTVEQRLLLALDMSLMMRALRKAGIRNDHPDWSEKEVMLQIHREAFLPDSLPPWIR